ncbi:MAG TPA: hypothetical protein VFS30_18360, partial [Dehalococcoidia bacterium]|nr:hypothetical protein [Dehalococcoidia bacterium]
MKRLRLAAFAASVLLIACSGDDATAPATPGVSPTTASSATLAAPNLAESHPRELIYWDSFFGEIGNPGGRREALLEAIGAAAQDDPAYRAFLVDLALYPTPYRDRAWELLDTGVPFSGDAVLELFGDLGPASPADDLDAYVEFKSILLSTIDPGFAALLNPREDHTISAQEVIWGGVPIDGIPA